MLPQKFSAATTRTAPWPSAAALTVPHPATASAASRVRSRDRPRTMSPTYHINKIDSYSLFYVDGPLPLTAMVTDDSGSWSEHVHGVLAHAGLKRGGARERIIDVLAGQRCALSAIEIEDELRARGLPTARASIYRVLDLLVEHGLAERVAVGEGQARFEPLHPSGHHHHHLVCDRCGRLVAFDDAALERAIDRLSDRLGVRIESHDVLLRGACERCD